MLGGSERRRKKRMKREIRRERRGRGEGEEGGIPEHKSSTKNDPF